MGSSASAVGHLDADCFYVSAERVRDEFLLKKPVGVLGNQGACVIAKSYEMKAAGVATGMPIWDALVKCPTGVYVKRDFRWYEILSRLMLGVVREWSPRVEYYSIDEFFFAAMPAPGPDVSRPGGVDPERDPGAGGRAGDGGDRPDPDARQADLGRGQAGRCAGSGRPPDRGGAAGRPAGDRDYRDRGPARPGSRPGGSSPASTWRRPTAGWSGHC